MESSVSVFMSNQEMSPPLPESSEGKSLFCTRNQNVVCKACDYVESKLGWLLDLGHLFDMIK